MRKTAITLAACLAFAAPAPAKDFLRAEGQRIVDERGQPVLLRGMGLGGWMLQEGYMLDIEGTGTQRSIRARIADLVGEPQAEAFYQAWRDNHTTRADIDALAAWGFNSIRLPMHYALYTLPVEQEPVPGQQTWLEEGFRRTDELLAWAKANDLYLVLDLHAAPGGQGNDINISDRDPDAPSLWEDRRNQDKMVALWKRLAERYKDEPHIAGYDILNEPNWGFADPEDRNGCRETGNAPLRELLVRTTRAIREVDTRHLVIIEGNCWGNNYRGVLDAGGAPGKGPWDDNLAISFHKYWNRTDPASIAEVLALREEHDVPLWLGETGENSNDWFARTVALVEGEGIGWAWWPLKKLRYNNPLQIMANDGYRKVLAYWNGAGPRPPREEAEAGLMALARHDVRHENNLVHADVIDALFRAPHSEESLPFGGHAIGRAGGRIAAIDFDLGRDGVAYHDLTPADEHVADGGERVVWNPARAYRNDGVDLGRGADGSLHVAGLERGEWLKYSFDAAQAGRFDLRLHTRGTGRVSLRLNDAAVPARAAEDRGTDFPGLPLRQGRNVLVVHAEDGPFDLEALEFRR